jgi:hypothetical protein
MYNFRSLICLLSIFTLLFGCKPTDKKENALQVDTKVDIISENLDEQFLAAGSVEEVQKLLQKFPGFQQYYFSDFEGDSVQLAQQLFSIYRNERFQEFKIQVDSIIGDRDSTILAPLLAAFSNIKRNFPMFKAPKVVFMMSGFVGNDVYISDSLLVIGLDYFGGSEASFRPNVFDYQLRRYQKEYIVPSVVYFMSERFNKSNPKDNTLLAEMIGIGKGFEFVRQVIPQCPDSLIIGYSGENLRKTYNSQTEIWAYFITQKLIYEKNTLKKEKYIGERPFTIEVGNEVPGGIARWIGWRIVSKYLEKHPDVTLSELMSTDNAPFLFEQSGYNGEKDEEE